MIHQLPWPAAAAIPHVKICGLCRLPDMLLAAELGASFLGVILTDKSPRRYRGGIDTLAELRAVYPVIRIIGVFVDEPVGEIARVAAELNLWAVQVHGPEWRPVKQSLGKEVHVLPALRIRNEHDARAIDDLAGHSPAVVTDAYREGAWGGTGALFDHRLVADHFVTTRVFLAGGLSHETIAGVGEALRGGPLPYAIDLSSGVEESPGIKSEEKMRRFFAEYRRAFGAS